MHVSLDETSPVVCLQDASKTSGCDFVKLSGIADDNGRKVVCFQMSAIFFMTDSSDGSGAQRTEEGRNQPSQEVFSQTITPHQHDFTVSYRTGEILGIHCRILDLMYILTSQS